MTVYRYSLFSLKCVALLCSVYQARLHEPNFTLFGWFLPKVDLFEHVIYSDWASRTCLL